MVDRVTYKPVTLGGMVLEAQKKAKETLANPLSGALTEQQSAIADKVSLSEGARAKLTAARKVEGYLRVFGSFLKLLNAPQYGTGQSTGTVQKPTIDRKV
jgi:hypothetical protein